MLRVKRSVKLPLSIEKEIKQFVKFFTLSG